MVSLHTCTHDPIVGVHDIHSWFVGPCHSSVIGLPYDHPRPSGSRQLAYKCYGWWPTTFDTSLVPKLTWWHVHVRLWVCVSWPFVDVVCLGLIWDSDQPPVDDIMAVVNNIGLTLQLSDVCNKYLRSMYDDNPWYMQVVLLSRVTTPFLFHSIQLGIALYIHVFAPWMGLCTHIITIMYNSATFFL